MIAGPDNILQRIGSSNNSWASPLYSESLDNLRGQ